MSSIYYKCPTETCVIHQQSTQISVHGACPVCKAPLVEVSNTIITPEEQYIIDHYPYVIAYQFKQMLVEQEPRIKLNQFKDTFYNYLKYIGLMTASELLFSELKSRDLVREFRKNLSQPSFGNWNIFTRKALQFLNEQKHEFFIHELPDYYATTDNKKEREMEILIEPDDEPAYREVRKLSAPHALVEFRNKYIGHNQTPIVEKAKELWNEFYPVFLNLLLDMRFVVDYPMYKQVNGQHLSLMSSDIEKALPINTAHNYAVWIENKNGDYRETLPFYVQLDREDSQVSIYESTTGESIKYFSPEGSETHKKGEFVSALNTLLNKKEKGTPLIPFNFQDNHRLISDVIDSANKYTLSDLKEEKKIFSHLYLKRNDIEQKLWEWVESSFSIFFIAAEAGSGKTNLLVEMQNQYQKSKYNALLLRAARFQKFSTLQDEIVYALNLSSEYPLKRYPFFYWKKDKPLFLLIDGLNESPDPPRLWKEILQLVHQFEGGKVKVVLTCRVNSDLDLDHYMLGEKDEQLLYHPDKQSEAEGLKELVHRLSPLDMSEMKNLWELYGEKRPDQYKPSFTFDSIAEYDRNIYNIISNPLVLRLFLQTYCGKVLPDRKADYMNVWTDWFTGLPLQQQELLLLLAQKAWETGRNQLVLEELIHGTAIQTYVQDNAPDSPLSELLKQGWISRYYIEGKLILSLTVEASLHYIAAKQLQYVGTGLDKDEIIRIVAKENPLLNGIIESYLLLDALEGNLDQIVDLVDESEKAIHLSVNPVIRYMHLKGVKSTLEQILKKPSENDWRLLVKIEDELAEVYATELRAEFINELFPRLSLNTRDELLLCIKSVLNIKEGLRDSTLRILRKKISDFHNDFEINGKMGSLEHDLGNYDQALEYLNKSLQSSQKKLGKEHRNVALYLNDIGLLWNAKGDFNKSLTYFQKSLTIRKKILGQNHPDLAESYNNIGLAYQNCGNFPEAMNKHMQSLQIHLQFHGESHPLTAISMNNIGTIWSEQGDFDKAIEYQLKSLNIRLKNFSNNHPDISNSLNNIGHNWSMKGDYDKALKYQIQSLEIDQQIFGMDHPSVANTLNNIGTQWHYKRSFTKALEYYERGLQIRQKKLSNNHPDLAVSLNNIGCVYGDLGNYKKAIEFCLRSLNIQKKTLSPEHPDVALALENIGYFYKKIGDYQKSLEYYATCLDTKQKTHAQDNSEILRILDIIIETCELNGNYEMQIFYLIKLFTILPKGGPAYQIYQCYNALSDIPNALEWLEKCALTREERIGLENKTTQDTYRELIEFTVKNGREDLANKYANKILS